MKTKNTIAAAILVATLSAALSGCGVWERMKDKASEAVLRTNLATLRDVIAQYHGDRKRCPASLSALVDAGYLRKVPLDPFTRSDSTWQVTYEASPGPGSARGIMDVHSGAPGTTRQGVPLTKL
jgi:general secretion pathway protein G